MSQVPFGATKQMADARVNIMSPSLKSLLLSLLSPHTPAGSIKSAVPSMKEVIIQLSWSAESEKSCSIDGKAIFTADTRKVPIKDVMATMSSIDWLFLVYVIYYMFP
jgi:NAD kinase